MPWADFIKHLDNAPGLGHRYIAVPGEVFEFDAAAPGTGHAARQFQSLSGCLKGKQSQIGIM